MTLSPGTRLGPYEVTAAIGAGGMGEVYRATDRKLAREVAIKAISSSVSSFLMAGIISPEQVWCDNLRRALGGIEERAKAK